MNRVEEILRKEFGNNLSQRNEEEGIDVGIVEGGRLEDRNDEIDMVLEEGYDRRNFPKRCWNKDMHLEDVVWYYKR